MNRHEPHDLAQMQSLPLEAKIRMTKERIRVWYESWTKYTIANKKTGKKRFVTWKEEPCKDGCYVKRTKKVNGEEVEADVLVPHTKLKPDEYIESAIDGQVYVSFSGGKDSTVLKHIVDSMYSDVPSVFVNTGLEYPEIQRFVREIKAGKYDCFNTDVEIIRPGMRFDEVIKTYGYPVVSKEVSNTVYGARHGGGTGKWKKSRMKKLNGELLDKDGKKSSYNCEKWKFLLDAPFEISNFCCDVMKKKPASDYTKKTGRKPIIATMAQESRLRKQKWIQNGCNAFTSKKPTSNPMSFWTEQDVLEYIVKYNVPYASVYGQIQEIDELPGQMYIDGFHDKLCTTGVDRTGCMFCMFGCHLEKAPNRFQRMAITHPKQYDYCMKPVENGGLGIAKVLDYIGVDYTPIDIPTNEIKSKPIKRENKGNKNNEYEDLL